jgi:uncharacterized protein YndB with AHSA1/START domain
MMHASSSAEPTVLIEHVFDFPREVVFDAWTNPELLARWFAPRGCTLRFERIDVRPGGGFHACVSNPSFGDCWTVAVYREIVRPERLSFEWRITDASGNPVSPQSQGHDPEWPAETTVSVTFVERNGRTTVTLAQNVSEALARRTGAHPSWIQMLEVLGEELTKRARGGDHA